jgi:23S rRNA pseudouridine1911/1915/1917 synthase
MNANLTNSPARTLCTHERAACLPASAAGHRFDTAVAALFPEFSRSRLTQWIKSGALTLDGRAVKARHVVMGGEQVRLHAPTESVVRDQPEDIALDVRYEDDDVLVINKPAGLVVHPGAGNPRGTLQNALLHHAPALAELPRAGIVHRLDKDTSGLLIVAKTLPAHTSLVAQLSRREIHRQYEAVALGTIIAGDTIDAPLGRHPHDRLRRAVIEDGKPAITHYRVRQRLPAHTVLQVNLETGRTHQIRVHLAHIGHPLIGDPLYGGGLRLPKQASPEIIAALRGFKRQALHAERVEFNHPRTGKTVAVDAPRPSDLARLIAALAKERGT